MPTLPPGVDEGDRVFLGSILTCGECRWCTEGFQNLCEHHLLYGYDPFPGAYADVRGGPADRDEEPDPAPATICPSDLATVADPFACALNGIEMLDIRLGDTVDDPRAPGPIGCWQAVMARDRGAEPRVHDRRQPRAARHGARASSGEFVDDAWVAGRGQRRRGGAVADRGLGVERVSVAAPSKQAQQAALEMAAKRARVVYFAGLPKHDPVSPLDMNQLHYKELAILGAYGATHRQYRITMDYLNRRREDLAGRGDAPVPARADRRGVRDDPVGRRAEDGHHPVTAARTSSAATSAARGRTPRCTRPTARWWRRRTRRTTCRSRIRRGPSRTRTLWVGAIERTVARLVARGAGGRVGDQGGCRSARSSTGWSCATPAGGRCGRR